jgi:hypothetical protein
MLGVPGLSALSLLSGVLLCIFAMLPGSDQRAKHLFLFLIVNIALTALVGLATRSFNAFTPSYSAWSLPVIALISASALKHASHRIRTASIVCIAVLAVANIYGTVRLVVGAEIYGHVRSTVIKSAVDAAGPGNVIVLYINDAPSLYFALNYYYGNTVRQYVAADGVIRLVGYPIGSTPVSLCELSAPTLLIAHDQQLSADELQFLATHPAVHTEALQAIDHYLKDHQPDLAAHWTVASRNEYLAQSALAFAALNSRGTGASPASTSCASAGSD